VLDKTQRSKLPKWALDYIVQLEKDIKHATKVAQCALDNQTKSPVWYIDNKSQKVFYVQCDRELFINFAGIEINMHLNKDMKCVDFSYHSEKHRSDDVILQPRSFQQFRIINPENSPK